MSRSAEAPRGLRIGGVGFDPATGDLKGPTGSTRLAPQPGALLILLLEQRGELVSRRAIAERLWPGGKDDPHQGIAFAVREIRRALDACGGEPATIETIPRRGLRLQPEPEHVARPMPRTVSHAERGTASQAGPETTSHAERGTTSQAGPETVFQAEPETASQAGPETVSEPRSPNPFRRDPGARRRLGVGLGLIVALGAAALVARLGTTPVLVLFEHAHDGGAVTSGLASDLSNQLTSSLTATFEDRLGVIGPTGVQALAGPNDVEAARSGMGACWVLSGSLRLDADPGQVIVFTQLVRTRDRVHVWAAQDTVPVANAASETLPGIISGVRDVLGDC